MKKTHEITLRIKEEEDLKKSIPALRERITALFFLGRMQNYGVRRYKSTNKKGTRYVFTMDATEGEEKAQYEAFTEFLSKDLHAHEVNEWMSFTPSKEIKAIFKEEFLRKIAQAKRAEVA